MDITFQLPELPAVAAQAWEQFGHRKIWLLDAGMGAGKTTFVHALCEGLGVTDAISSPTFAIVNEYRSKLAGTIYHMDWYRLKDEDEAIQAGIEDYLYSNSLCLIEWPNKAPGILPDETVHVQLQVVDAQTRRLIIS
ncbi:tRNA (adenosine(37)-N6)-threonylcarbamoyltransferase complex ATPase subunit type 1 TsaE [Deminuibacter soli]|uniref:tRNA threonylcarbamoyladenosine biosynthesis protein TsaE n=1 Tax=Deminuibacter soli TaxID=2291815 RepID=A0A3E1NFF1_9BACT|nr:tRNA (adenosine(37)-N6)-threonylcarbamoyltransferase complex ATPase subunit type 1 TsaE [Deminuibacter soli]RFM26705.1 tRNA (adenosine(37)-N6)-threonylcarbamoyltransferase complex ATPase subunit type 1 TsaE [Deminuibacter soli]